MAKNDKQSIIFRDEWLAALRSGKYKQGKDALRTADNKFCCLGVYCDILQEKGYGEWEVDYAAKKHRFKYKNCESISVLPQSVVKIFGFKDTCGIGFVETKTSNGDLTEFNDKGISFYNIAKIIEANTENANVIKKNGKIYKEIGQC